MGPENSFRVARTATVRIRLVPTCDTTVSDSGSETGRVICGRDPTQRPDVRSFGGCVEPTPSKTYRAVRIRFQTTADGRPRADNCHLPGIPNELHVRRGRGV